MNTPLQERQYLTPRFLSREWLGGVWLALMNALLITCRFLVVIGFLNVLSFILLSLLLGGDAIAGGRSDGHYYLSSHGHRTEVSHRVWACCRFHAYSAIISAPAVIIAGIVAGVIKKKYPAVEPDMPD
jgi:hypothetical protein